MPGAIRALPGPNRLCQPLEGRWAPGSRSAFQGFSVEPRTPHSPVVRETPELPGPFEMREMGLARLTSPIIDYPDLPRDGGINFPSQAGINILNTWPAHGVIISRRCVFTLSLSSRLKEILAGSQVTATYSSKFSWLALLFCLPPVLGDGRGDPVRAPPPLTT